MFKSTPAVLQGLVQNKRRGGINTWNSPYFVKWIFTDYRATGLTGLLSSLYQDVVQVLNRSINVFCRLQHRCLKLLCEVAFRGCQISSYRNLQTGLVKGVWFLYNHIFPLKMFLYLNKNVILQILCPLEIIVSLMKLRKLCIRKHCLLGLKTLDTGFHGISSCKVNKHFVQH